MAGLALRLCAMLFFAFATLSLAAPPRATAQAGPPPTVTVAKPISRKIDKWDEYTGRFEAIQRVEVRARVSGFVDQIQFTDGQMVKAGDPLFVIDPRPYRLAVESAQADVTHYKALVAQAASDVARAQVLTQNVIITARDADQRKATLDVARAQQQSAEVAVRNAQLNLEWTEVRAPIAGRISDRRVDVGNLVQGGQTGATMLTTIVSLDPIHFVFDASESDYLRYARLARLGERPSSREARNRVQVRLADETTWAHNGVMNFVDNEIAGRSGTVRGRAVMENKDGFLTPGVFGRVRVFGGSADVLLIPDEAVISDQSRKIVFTVGAGDKIVPKPVTLGPMALGLRVVSAGLSPDDLVVIGGLANPFVRPDAAVSPTHGDVKTAGD